MLAGEYRDPETGVALYLPMRASIALYLIERWLGDPAALSGRRKVRCVIDHSRPVSSC